MRCSEGKKLCFLFCSCLSLMDLGSQQVWGRGREQGGVCAIRREQIWSTWLPELLRKPLAFLVPEHHWARATGSNATGSLLLANASAAVWSIRHSLSMLQKELWLQNPRTQCWRWPSSPSTILLPGSLCAERLLQGKKVRKHLFHDVCHRKSHLSPGRC